VQAPSSLFSEVAGSSSLPAHEMNDIVLQGALLDAAEAAVWQTRCQASDRRQLAPGVWRFPDATPGAGLVDQAHAAGLDAFSIDHPLRRKDFRVLAMDMDSTLITIECIDEIADLAGVKPEVAAVTAAAMRGELDFPGALRRRVALLEGLPAAALERVYEERLRLSPGAESLLAMARESGWTTVLVSGGFEFFTERLKRRLGLDHALANTLEISDGRLTGKVLGSIVDADAKANKVRLECAALGCGPGQAVVIGDGANDLKMMAGAGLSVAFHAKPVVRAQAAISVVHGGLDAIRWRFES